MADNETPKSTRDVDDISLDDARPPRKGGGVGTIILVIVVIAAVLALAWWLREGKRAEERAKADAVRQAMMDMVKTNIQDAVAAADLGDIDLALNKLQIAEDKLGQIITAANTDNNQNAAAEAMTKRQFVIDARQAIADEQARYKAAVNEQLGGLRAAFGVAATVAAPDAAAPATDATSTTPAPEAGAVSPDPAAPVAPEAASQLPTAPETAPAVPAAPEAAAPAAPAAPALPAAPAAPAPVPAS